MPRLPIHGVNLTRQPIQVTAVIGISKGQCTRNIVQKGGKPEDYMFFDVSQQYEDLSEIERRGMVKRFGK